MSDTKAIYGKDDTILLALFNLTASQAQAIMKLSNALRNDPALTDETRIAAEKTFASIPEMLDQLNTISAAAWGTGSDD